MRIHLNVIDRLPSGAEATDQAAFDRVVPAHHGGEVTVVERLNIILSHSFHHLKQVYWFMETELGVKPEQPASADDLEGMVTPEALI